MRPPGDEPRSRPEDGASPVVSPAAPAPVGSGARRVQGDSGASRHWVGRTILGNLLVFVGAGAVGSVMLLLLLRVWSTRSASWTTVLIAGAVAGALVVVMTVGRRPEASDDRVEHGPLLGECPVASNDRGRVVAGLASLTVGADGAGVAMLFVRLDRLDLINARLGRRVGDEVMSTLALRLARAAGPAEVVGRVSASSLVVARADREGAHLWAAHIVATLRDPIEVHELVLHLTCASVLVTTDGFHRDAASLLERAEFAARDHLANGRDQVEHVELVFAGPDVTDQVAARVQMAVEAGEIIPAYQPVVDLRSMQVVGLEALARWPGAPAGMEAPEDFLEVVEALGLQTRLFDDMFRQVVEAFATGPGAERDWWVSINLGPDECIDPTLPTRIGRGLADAGLPPERLVLEVSERAIPDPAVGRALQHLVDLGVALAIDDFGSGWSTLAQIRSLPISLIKLDRDLVTAPTPSEANVIMATVALASALGIDTLAEGVEAGEDLLLLCLAECRYGQGFWWSEAAPLEEILAKFPANDDLDDGPYATVFDMAAVRAANDGPDDDAHQPEGDIGPTLEAALRDHAAPCGEDPSVEPHEPPGDAPPLPWRDPIDLEGINEADWLDLSDEDFIAKLRALRADDHEPTIQEVHS
jgi:EAL domain-containing protein (putative c-di-GMP-specific phosphodiesterase class I)/GGDEF domain-containing protein